jgi:hypothetical protein
MHLGAMAGSLCLHVTGAALAWFSQPYSAFWPTITHYSAGHGWTDGLRIPSQPGHPTEASLTLQLPQVRLAAPDGPGIATIRTRSECPAQDRLDEPAVPDFPVLGDAGPFADLPETPRSPLFCIRIGVDGHVRAVILVTSSGNPARDRALRFDILHLRFEPARRAGKAVNAWHRFAVNRGAGKDWVVEPYPFAVPAPPPPFERPEDRIILVD